MKKYQVLVPKVTFERTATYLRNLKNKSQRTGFYLYKALKNKNIQTLETEDLLELLMQTKQPQIFAESAVKGDGSDWNLMELSILGDISIAVSVSIFDNGQHQQPQVYQEPFDAVLLFTPGALLRNDRHYPPADWGAVVRAGKINYKQFYQLYERRLLPLLIYANKQAEQLKKQALITIPGLGCGMFAGIFQGELGAVLEQVLIDLLKKYATYFPLIKAIYYDPYKECSNKRLEINGVSLLVRPLLQGNQGKAQLSKPVLLEEEGDDFSNCMLFSVVAWDHVSWPGNDFYINSRATDDGVKAAATDSMWKMTGIKGLYNKKIYAYEPPSSYSNWDAVVAQHDLKITLKGQVLVLPNKEMPL